MVIPTSIKRAGLAVGVVSAIHVIALILLQTHSQEISATIHQLRPNMSAETFQQAYTQAVTTPSIVHIVLPILLLLAMRSVWVKKTPFSRMCLSLLLLIQILAHATIPITVATLPQEATTVIAVQGLSFVFELAALIWLWATKDSRAYFKNVRAVRP